jgi:hypothetical protein
MLNKRKSPRRKMVLPVKVSIDKVSGLAHTLDVTPSGARLGALRGQLQPGTVITLQRGAKKAEFRVEWVKQLAANELQAGIEALQSQSNFWGIDLTGEVDIKKEGETLMSLLSRPSKSVM